MRTTSYRPLFGERDRQTIIGTLAALMVGCGSGCETATSEDVFEGVPTWTIVERPLAAIGGQGDRPEYLLNGVVGVVRLSDGTLVVGEQSGNIRFYDETGQHRRTVGGAGQGPGEFQSIYHITRLAGDSLLVVSRRPGLSWLSPQGDYLRSQAVRDLMGAVRHPCRIGGYPWRTLPGGDVLNTLEDNRGAPGCEPSSDGLWRGTTLVERQDLVQGHYDTVAVLPGTERKGPDWRVFGRSALVAAGRDRIYVTDTATDTILVLGLVGDTLGVVQVPFEPTRVPRSARRVRARPSVEGDGSLGDAFSYPDTYPAVGHLLVDALGYLWVMGYPRTDEPIRSWWLTSLYHPYVEDGGARWRVVDGEGQLAAQVRTPPGFLPIEIGEDWILGVSRDDLGVETVNLYQLVR